MKTITQKTLCLMLLCFCAIFSSKAQEPLDGIRICLDPGHGGHDSNDRPTELGLGVTYYESDANWEVVGYLDTLLQKLGAEVKVTKVTNDPEAEDRDPSLSDRVQVGNAFESDYFHSFHTNGVDNQTVNYTLVLYAGPEDGTADYPESYEMAEIMDDELFAYMRTTTKYARADIPFTGYTNGLGVLNNLNMPSTLSEASFHSNLNEGRRLMSSSYRKAAAWSIVKSFLAYFEQPDLSVGEAGGLVLDRDGAALNEITVTLQPGAEDEQVFEGDVFLNGFYFFDWLAPGSYEMKVEKFGYDAKIQTIDIVAGEYTETDFELTEVGGAPAVPQMLALEAVGTSGVSVKWAANTEETLLGYRLYYATDDTMENWTLAADETTLDETTTSVVLASDADFKYTPQEEAYHFELRSVAESGAESEGGQVFSRLGATADQVLIVDGFDRRSGSYTEEYHTFISDYMMAIRDMRLAGISSSTNESVVDGKVSLSDYDLVVWILGDESTTNETFSTSEQALIADYLDAGGNLLVSGSEIGWDLGIKGDAADQAFYASYLKATCIGDGSVTFSPATGLEGTLFGGQTIDFGITYPEDYPDDIAAVEGAEEVFSYAVEGAHGGVGYKGVFGNSTEAGGVLYFSFPIETTSTLDQQFLLKNAMDYLEVGSYYDYTPTRPTLLSATESEAGRVLSWTASSDDALLSGFRVYYSLDDDLSTRVLLADESELTSTTYELVLVDEYFTDHSADEVSVFSVVAVADGGSESLSSDTYAVKSSDVAFKTLIVDGFDRVSGSYKSGNHDFAARYYLGASAAYDGTVHTVANEQVADGVVSLMDYDRVFWFLGDESTVYETLSDGEQVLLQAYLDQGGQLFISGSEIGWDLYSKGTTTDQAFYTNYLKAVYQSDGGPSFTVAEGVAGGLFETLNVPIGVVYPEDYPDEISATEDAENIFSFNDSEHFSGVAYEGAFGGEATGAVIYISFPLETAVQSDLEAVIAQVSAYLKGEEEVLASSEQIDQAWVLYPNPSSGDATLQIGNAADQIYTIAVYDIQGHKHNQWMIQSVDHQISLPTAELSSGMYWLSIQSDDAKSMIRFLKQ